MVKITERDLAIIAGLAGVADFLTEGRFSAPVARALKRAFGRAAPVAARGAARFVPAAVGTARLVAMRHPAVALGAVIYVGWHEREKIRTLLDQGYDIVEEPVRQYLGGVEQRGREFLADPLGGIQEMREERKRFQAKYPAIRKASAFNKAVSAGMKAVKKSTSYGGKGKIRPATKVFAMVTKLAAAKKKKKKAPKKGIRRLIWNAMKGLR